MFAVAARRAGVDLWLDKADTLLAVRGGKGEHWPRETTNADGLFGGEGLSGAAPTPRLTGILPAQDIRAMIRGREITATVDIGEEQIQPASLDLRLGRVAYRVRASFLPGPEATVHDRLAAFGMHEIDLAAGAVLEKGCVYIVPADGKRGAEKPRLGAGQSEKLHRPARRVHPADHRPLGGLRPGRRRLQGPALRRNLAPDLQRRRPPGQPPQPASFAARQPAVQRHGPAPVASDDASGGRRDRCDCGGYRSGHRRDRRSGRGSRRGGPARPARGLARPPPHRPDRPGPGRSLSPGGFLGAGWRRRRRDA